MIDRRKSEAIGRSAWLDTQQDLIAIGKCHYEISSHPNMRSRAKVNY